MIEIKVGKKSEFMDAKGFQKISAGFKEIIYDIGCGEGKFVYDLAKKNPESLMIGIDPNRNALEDYSAKVRKKPSKGGLSNVAYIISALETIPEELINTANKIFINFPWGTLLSIVYHAEDKGLKAIQQLARENCEFTIIFNHSSKYEPHEMSKLGIEDLSIKYIESYLKPNYQKYDIEILDFKLLNNEEIKSRSDTWGRKLAFGRERPIWEINAVVNKNSQFEKKNVNKDNLNNAISYSFAVQGHRNILSQHVKTLEFTKDTDLTLRGDCIVGVSSTFELNELKKFSNWVNFEIKTQNASDQLKCFINPEFSSNHELVIRRSKFGSERTFGILSNKASSNLNKNLIKDLQAGLTAEVTIKQKVKKVHVNKYKL